MEEKTTTIHVVTVLVLIAVGLVLASIATNAGTVHAQANNTSTATKNMTSGATAGGNMTNATAGGNQSAANATNPLAKVPVIGKLFGGK
jgi:L-asparagine transporter-like permease